MSLDTIDISSNQSKIDLRHITGLDACIVKATEGKGYVSSLFKSQYSQAKSLDLARGAYHFAGSSWYKRIYSPQIEWEKFYSVVRNTVIKDGILMLDFEPYGYAMSIREEMVWVKQWMELAHGTTGVWPILYMDYSHVMMWHNYSEVMAKEIAVNCGLLIAGGPYYNTVFHGFNPNLNFPFSVPTYWNLFGWQYTSHGEVNGYQPLDFDVVHVDRAGWTKYAHGDNEVKVVPPKGKVTHHPIMKSKKQYYRIEPGDSLIKIGHKFNVDWHRLATLNKLHPPYVIYAGRQLRIK